MLTFETEHNHMSSRKGTRVSGFFFFFAVVFIKLLCNRCGIH